MAAAFVSPDGSTATVVMHRTGEAIDFALRVGDTGVDVERPPRSIATCLTGRDTG